MSRSALSDLLSRMAVRGGADQSEAGSTAAYDPKETFAFSLTGPPRSLGWIEFEREVDEAWAETCGVSLEHQLGDHRSRARW
jgi:hypothetical protein